MPSRTPLELDIRPICAARQAPLPAILDTVQRLAPDQDFRLIAPFEPAPLYQLLANHGFSAHPQEEPAGTWTILFTRN